ncbi:hypothetical protein J5N97_027260 [Dioscorea zingiberensis]|uniref:Fibronectin type III-like domain-containing protein n=1 Tax=Dioscorea zingiberensis TaxID=325984 RepID=A0A9D5H7L3_9LILI|nr:hypothetical protein J5N97_027260 [Dioscorea zingiberensis]
MASSILTLISFIISFTLYLVSTSAITPAAPPGPIPGPLPGYGPIETNGKKYAYVCDPARFTALNLDVKTFSYCNTTLPFSARVKDLVGRMTLQEKVLQLGDYAQGAPRIGLPVYKWWSEALHGISTVGQGPRTSPSHATYFGDVVPGATSFPTPLLSAASFNETLWNQLAQVVSTEGRAMYNLGHTFLTFWSPNINIARDPRWGRILETPGEDPFVVGRYSVNFVRGLQDVPGRVVPPNLNERPLKVSACCKHYGAYDVDQWFGIQRITNDARVAEQDMVESFNYPFEMCVKEGDVSSVMCSYNKVNGIPACADTKLMSQTIRGDWKLHGYIVSDCDSVEVMHDAQQWLGDTPEESVMRAMRAGLDLDCGSYYTDHTVAAVQQGKVRESDVDNALTNLYTVLMRVGFFDNLLEYQKLGTESICTKENIELAAEAARQGIVLLKNDNSSLPFNNMTHSHIAVVGPHANSSKPMLGNYAGVPCRYITPLQALSADARVEFDLGCDVWCHNQAAKDHAKQLAMTTDATIIFGGIDLDVEAEAHDRWDLNLPPDQITFITEVAEAAKGPVVLVLFSGGGLDVTFAKNNSKINAILWAGYPGNDGGKAISDVIYGRQNPAGRLPITWYPSQYTEILPMTSMKFRPVEELGYPGRTYKFYDGPVVYPFGFGLSYTQFTYNLSLPQNSSVVDVKLGPDQKCLAVEYKPNTQVPPSACAAVKIADTNCNQSINLDLRVTNAGKVDGSHVIIVYAKPPQYIAGAPIKKVIAFQRALLKVGQTQYVQISVNVCDALGLVDKSAYQILASGQYTIEIENGDIVANVTLPVNFN